MELEYDANKKILAVSVANRDQRGREVSINSGTVILNNHYPSPESYGYVTNTSLSIPCEDLERTGEAVLTLNFCKESEEICVDLTFNLVCTECDNNRKAQVEQTAKVNDSYVVYPNPTKDIIYIEIIRESNIQYFKLYDVVNRLVINKRLEYGLNKIYTSNLPAGVYNLEIIMEEESFIEKIIIVD